MPTLERNDQPEDQTKDEKDSPSSEASNSSKTEARQIKQSGKVAAKKKTARKKAAKKEASPTRRKEAQPEQPAEGSVSPAAAPPLHSQPQTVGATGLMGFWIKAGASAFVILAGVIGIYTFFSEDETTSRPEATQAVAGAQGDDASVTGRVVVPPPATQQSNVVDPESSHGYRNEPGTFAGAAVANEPVVGSSITAGVTPGVTPAADQPLAGRLDAAPEPAGYRPERYRPLEPEQDPPPQTQPNATNETPRASSVPVPYYYPQPGAYAHPPYGGYGRYYRY